MPRRRSLTGQLYRAARFDGSLCREQGTDRLGQAACPCQGLRQANGPHAVDPQGVRAEQVSDKGSEPSDLDERAWELHTMRESYYEIGRQLGISPEEAQEAVSRAWLAHPLPTREQEVAKMLAWVDPS